MGTLLQTRRDRGSLRTTRTRRPDASRPAVGAAAAAVRRAARRRSSAPGNDEAFRVIHDRYRPRLFAYTRQMLGGSRSDAEDALQDVFLRAYNALRVDERPVALKAWLYRVAHNRCIDHLRRPVPPPTDVFEISRTPLPDPLAEAERRDDLRRLVADVQRLPEQQRSALLMREIEGLSYADLAEALDVSVPAVKSLLVRARIGLVEAAEARDTACSEIRDDLALSFGKGVRASALARKHMRECDGCREYRTRAARRPAAASARSTPGLARRPAGQAPRPRRRRRRGRRRRGGRRRRARSCGGGVVAGDDREGRGDRLLRGDRRRRRGRGRATRTGRTAAPARDAGQAAPAPRRARRAATGAPGAAPPPTPPPRRGRAPPSRRAREGRRARRPRPRAAAGAAAAAADRRPPRTSRSPRTSARRSRPTTATPPTGGRGAAGRRGGGARGDRRAAAAVAGDRRRAGRAGRRRSRDRDADDRRAGRAARPRRASTAAPAAATPAADRGHVAAPARRRPARRRRPAALGSGAIERYLATLDHEDLLVRRGAALRASSASSPSTRPRAARRSAAAGCGTTTTRARRCATRCACRAR